MKVFIGVALALAAVLLGVAIAAANHGQTIQAGMLGMGAATAAFIAGVFVGGRS